MMTPRFQKFAALLVVGGLAAAAAGCGEIHGSKTIDTSPPAEAEGHGPGLFTGKEGGFVIYNEVWGGNAPDGGTPE